MSRPLLDGAVQVAPTCPWIDRVIRLSRDSMPEDAHIELVGLMEKIREDNSRLRLNLRLYERAHKKAVNK